MQIKKYKTSLKIIDKTCFLSMKGRWVKTSLKHTSNSRKSTLRNRSRNRWVERRNQMCYVHPI